jgi:addiction module RelE/StbE family toxin
MKVVFSRRALADLDEVLTYIARNSPLGAERVHAGLLRSIQRVADHPLSVQAVEQRPDIRRLRLVRYPYIIYYEVGATEVTILRILHGARQQPWE